MDKFVFLLSVAAVLIVGLITLSAALRRRQQNQMHNRLLDKFTTAHELGAFLDSASGREYIANLTDNVGSPVPAIIASVRSGIILCFVGAGFFVPSVRGLNEEFPIAAIGTLVVALGIGFLASAAATFFLARELQLMEKRDDSRQ